VKATGDADLLARAREGDMDAFAALVGRYEVRVGTVLRRLLDDARDVEEALQDTFVQAWRNLDRFRHESATFTWLYRIAVNEALQRLRRKPPPTSELDAFAEGARSRQAGEAAPSVEESVGDEELRRFLAHRLRQLPFEYRAPLVLRDVEGLSNQEVADILGISLAAAKSRIHRARMRIRADLEEWERRGGSL
jgi:RNA polymerase sigma-70 factor (ECF subfamily)